MIDSDMKSKKPTVSVIVNCFNGEKYLHEAIESIYAQTYKDWEIVFWDNASIDNSAKIAKGYDSRLKYYRGEKNIPLYAARNLAIKHTRGDFIAFLDCDDIWLPTKLEKQIGLFSDDKVGLVFSNTYFFNQKTGKHRILYKKNPPSGMIFRQLIAKYFLSLETVVIRKKSLQSLAEYFDDRFNAVGDADLFIRICNCWNAAYVDEPLGKWRIHGENITILKIEQFGIELKMMLDKYRKLYNNFDKDYSREIDKLESKIAYYIGVSLWQKGSNRKARSIIRPFIKKDYRLLLPYFFSWVKYKYYLGFINLFESKAV